MKVIVSRKEITEAVKIVNKAAAVKPATPILAGIYFKAEGSMLEMQATDFSIGIVAKIPAVVEEEGETVLIGKYFLEMLLKLKSDTVAVTTKDNTAEVKSAVTKYNLLIFDPADFPKIKQEENLQSFTLRQRQLKKLIKQSAFASADDKEASRTIFTGVLFNFEGENLTLAATNTHRIAVVTEKISEEEKNLQFIVSAKKLQEISAYLEEVGEIKIGYSGKTASFNFDNLFVTLRVIEGNFPEFERLLNEEKNIFATVEVAEFRNAVERMSIIAKLAEYEVIGLQFANNEIKISATSSDVGNAEEVVPAEIEGGELEIFFNHNYIFDALKVIDAEKIKIGLTGKLAPIDIKIVDDDSFRYVVTPVRRN